MLVKDAMRKEVVTVDRSTTLSQLLSLFHRHNYRFFPVTDQEDILVGVVSLEDILKIFQPHSPAISEILRTIPMLDEEIELDILRVDLPPGVGLLFLVEDLMTKRYVTITDRAPISQALHTMRSHKVDRLLVVKRQHLVGIISMLDVIWAVMKEKRVIS